MTLAEEWAALMALPIGRGMLLICCVMACQMAILWRALWLAWRERDDADDACERVARQLDVARGGPPKDWGAQR